MNKQRRGHLDALEGFPRLFNPARGPQQSNGSAGAEPIEQQLDVEGLARELDDAVEKVKEAAGKFRLVPEQGSLAAGIAERKASEEGRRADRAQAREEAQTRIWGEILQLHQELGTGLGIEELSAGRDLLLEFDEVLAGKRFHGTDQAVRAATIRRALPECKEIAWHVLRQAMDARGLAWPEPIGLTPWAEGEEVATARKRGLAQSEEEFRSASPAVSAERLRGVVTAWKAYYPSPDSPLWRRTVIEAVGHGILAHLVATGAQEVQQAGGDLKALFGELVGEQLTTVRGALQKGLHSASDSDELLRAVRHLCQEVVPELVWNRMQKVVYAAAERIAAEARS